MQIPFFIHIDEISDLQPAIAEYSGSSLRQLIIAAKHHTTTKIQLSYRIHWHFSELIVAD
ncbi:hypothetical protein D1872_288560 [compost metagenome]